MLGGLVAQKELGVASIGGKDSSSGTFNDIDVPPTLIAFTVSTAKTDKVVSSEWKGANHNIYLLKPEYKDGDMFLFGRETAGLPKDFIAANQEMTVRIPMSKETRMRSLNLANCGNIILFEALRQMGFPGLK